MSDGASGPAGDPLAHTQHLVRVNERLVLSLVRDHELTAEARDRLARTQSLLESLHDGVVVIDPGGEITTLNAAAKRMLGLSAAALPIAPQGYAHLAFRNLDGSPLPCDLWPFARAIRGERFFAAEHLLAHPGRPVCRIAFNGSAPAAEAGRSETALVVCRDVTELRALEQLRQEYVALISHDLRGPLNTIALAADLLALRLAEENRTKDVALAEMASRGAHVMGNMVQELLESAYLSSAEMELGKAAVDLAAFVEGTVSRLGMSAARVRVHLPPPHQCPALVVDAARLERALSNLLTNALKYSAPDAPVDLRVDAGDEVVFSVSDTGVGIPPDDLPHVFDRFYRVRRANTATGFGLGLYITRLIVLAHGGEVRVRSAPGEGSTFSFSIPAP